MPLEGIRQNGLRDTVAGLAQNRSGRLGQRRNELAEGSEEGHRDAFTENTWSQTFSNMEDGTFVRVAEYEQIAQTGHVYGYGSVRNDPENQGDFVLTNWVDETDGNDIEGYFRLKSENARGRNVEDHGTFHSRKLRNGGVKLPEVDMDMVLQDSFLYLEFELDESASDADGTNDIDWDEAQLTIDMTEFVNPQ